MNEMRSWNISEQNVESTQRLVNGEADAAVAF